MSTQIRNYTTQTFTPTVTLVGGAGNTVPVYSTNTGNYTKIGHRVFVEVYLTGDGGAEGAGTGVFNVALPVTAAATHPGGIFQAGTISNNAEERPCYGVIAGAVATVALKTQEATIGALQSNIIDVTGADQGNATRAIMLKFNYDV